MTLPPVRATAVNKYFNKIEKKYNKEKYVKIEQSIDCYKNNGASDNDQ